jgi:hypothetical protein
MSNWYELKETLVKDLMDLAKDRPHPMIWIAGVAMSMLASLCYYDSANLVRVRHKLKQLKQQQLDSKCNQQ